MFLPALPGTFPSPYVQLSQPKLWSLSYAPHHHHPLSSPLDSLFSSSPMCICVPKFTKKKKRTQFLNICLPAFVFVCFCFVFLSGFVSSLLIDYHLWFKTASWSSSLFFCNSIYMPCTHQNIVWIVSNCDGPFKKKKRTSSPGGDGYSVPTSPSGSTPTPFNKNWTYTSNSLNKKESKIDPASTIERSGCC